MKKKKQIKKYRFKKNEFYLFNHRGTSLIVQYIGRSYDRFRYSRRDKRYKIDITKRVNFKIIMSNRKCHKIGSKLHFIIFSTNLHPNAYLKGGWIYEETQKLDKFVLLENQSLP